MRLKERKAMAMMERRNRVVVNGYNKSSRKDSATARCIRRGT